MKRKADAEQEKKHIAEAFLNSDYFLAEVQKEMEITGVDEQQARFRVSMEYDLTDGDVIEEESFEDAVQRQMDVLGISREKARLIILKALELDGGSAIAPPENAPEIPNDAKGPQ